MIQIFLGSALFFGLAVGGSDGPWFPWINFLAMGGVVIILALIEDRGGRGKNDRL